VTRATRSNLAPALAILAAGMAPSEPCAGPRPISVLVLLGETRDLETMQAALTLAEMGHLVFGTLHTNSAAQTISRVVSAYAYLNAMTRSLEQVTTARPLNQARLLADTSTLAMIRTQLGLYHSQHGGWSRSREAVAMLLAAAPRFQCPGNDYTYDPTSGAAGLLITDPGRC
jgi:hypothetical protein